MTSDLLPGLKRASALYWDTAQTTPRLLFGDVIDRAIKAEEAKMDDARAAKADWVGMKDALVRDGMMKPASPFKPGGQYKTRDGREAVVDAINTNDDAHPVLGRIKQTEGAWTQETWASSGAYCIGITTPNNCDLMPPTRKVKRMLYVWRSVDGIVRCAVRPDGDGYIMRNDDTMLINAQPVEWTEPA